MLLRLRNRHFFVLDTLLLILTPILALSLRLKLPWDPKYTPNLMLYILWALVVKLVVFYLFGLYKRLWRYASIDALIVIVMAVGIASVITTGVFFTFQGVGMLESPEAMGLPRSVPIIDSMLTLLVIG